MTDHEIFMSRCLQLARYGELYVRSNPMVGCVIVHNDVIVAEGYHQRYGEAHAEVNAFADLPPSIDSKECSVYVSLEPCSHHGKTPPCADLIVSRSPKRVVIGMLDPNPVVTGSGKQRIEEAGIEVVTGVLENECRKMNEHFIHYHTTRYPFITLKWAATANGLMGRLPGDLGPKQISAPEQQALVHRLRARHMAIMVGAYTANVDDPQLNVRHWEGEDPVKVVWSPSGSVDPNLRMFTIGRSLVYTANPDLEILGVEVICLTDCSLPAVMRDLGRKNIISVLVEGGAGVLNECVKLDLWNRAIEIISHNEWEQGIAAPVLDLTPDEELVNVDTIKSYSNTWQ